MIIQFDEIINDYSENVFEISRKYLEDYLSCYYIKQNDLSRSELLEKLCDYIMAFEYRNNKKDSTIPGLYINELLPLMNKIVKSPKKDETICQAYKYVMRAQDIAEKIKKSESENLLEDLEDFTKIFLCIYDDFLKHNHEKVETIEFKIRGIGFDYIRTDLIKEKRFKLLRQKNKANEETIYNVLKINEKNNIYNSRNFVVMILSLFYIRLTDLEGC